MEFNKFMLKCTDYTNVSDKVVLVGIVSLNDLNVTERPKTSRFITKLSLQPMDKLTKPLNRFAYNTPVKIKRVWVFT